jgi:hypothetical protein
MAGVRHSINSNTSSRCSDRLSSELKANWGRFGEAERHPSFGGHAAASYDDYIAEWHSSQMKLLDAMRGVVSMNEKLRDYLFTPCCPPGLSAFDL